MHKYVTRSQVSRESPKTQFKNHNSRRAITTFQKVLALSQDQTHNSSLKGEHIPMMAIVLLLTGRHNCPKGGG